MKQEVKDIAVELTTKTVPAGGAAWWAQLTLSDINWTAVLTGVFVFVQIIYLLRKWWREETEWGVKLKRWAERTGITRPAELDDR